MSQKDNLKIEKEILNDFNRASQLEWLETNGIGGFSSQTVVGSNSRRYHGLLVAALNPPRERYVLLSKFEERLRIDESVYNFSTNQYRLTVHPQGFQYLTSFEIDPFPTWTYEIQGVRFMKTIWMPHGKNQVVVMYRLLSSPRNKKLQIEINPLLAYRDYHGLAHSNSAINSKLIIGERYLEILPYQDVPVLRLYHNAAMVDPLKTYWYYQFEYLEELKRGLDAYEDLFCAGEMTFDLTLEKCAYAVASIDPAEDFRVNTINELERVEKERRLKLSRKNDSELAKNLKRAADQFVVSSCAQEISMIAGYHWFTDWGRDTMISIPGILLAADKYTEAKSVLSNFFKYLDQGMIPNYFPDAGQAPEYNTVDATLWLFEVIRLYMVEVNDLAFLKSIWTKLNDIIAWHEKGTRFGIKVDPRDGLLDAGELGLQLTWMDAKVGDWVVTPRMGKAVEINALWYHALTVMAQLAKELNDEKSARQFDRSAQKVRESFRIKFWNPNKKCLYDFVQDQYSNTQIRPNQIFAVSLSPDLLTQDQKESVVRMVQADLLTPYGLRSLAASDSEYQKHYQGGPRERDGAYHQGTVWAWLIGPFISAYLNTFGRSENHLAYARSLLKPLEVHLIKSACIGSISEIFDAELPHEPKGCVAQAWSVAELLRVLKYEFGELNKRRLGYRDNKKETVAV